MADLVTVEEIERAQSAQPPQIRLTPTVPFADRFEDVGAERLHLKLENLQVTGSYKARAAFHVLRALDPEERERGIVMPSSGNFGLAFAFAGRELGIPVVVVSSPGLTRFKLEAMRAFSAEVVVAGGYDDRFTIVDEIARERDMVPIRTTSDRRVPTGHGTIGLEIAEQRPDVDTVLVPVSSGHLLGGIAVAVKSRRPGVRVIGVQPEGGDAMYRSFRAGEPRSIKTNRTIADALSATSVHPFAFAHVKAYVDDITLVREDQIADALRLLLDRGKILAEPAGAVPVAAYLARGDAEWGTTVAVVSGGNVGQESLRELLGSPASA